MGSCWCSLDVGDLWILQTKLSILRGGSSDGVLVWLNDSLDNVDGISSGTVSSSHFTVHLGDGSAKSVVSVLLVHVDDTGSSKISKHDSVILDRVGFSLEDLTNRDNLS